MKNTNKADRLGKMLWPLLLSLMILIESVTGSAVVYAEETTGSDNAAPAVTEGTKENEDASEKADSGNGDSQKNESGDEETSDNQNNDDEKDKQDNSDEGENSEDSEDESADPAGTDEMTAETEEEFAGELTDEEPEKEFAEELADEESEKERAERLQRARELFGEDFDQDDLDELIRQLNELPKEWDNEGRYAANGHLNIDFDVWGTDASVPRTFSVLPSYYDAREAGVITPVRDQGKWGVCWSFAVMAAAESAYVRLYGDRDINLSETHLVNFTYNGNYKDHDQLKGPDGGLAGDYSYVYVNPTEIGGNGIFATLALASWAGIADEKADASLAYPDMPSESDTLPYMAPELAYQDVLHLENSYWIPMEDKDGIKKAVMEYGAVGIGYNSNTEYGPARVEGKSVPAVQYYSFAHGEDEEEAAPNHDVAIIGWNDDFSRDDFKYTYDNICRHEGVKKYAGNKQDPLLPEHDGAWLIKNSWGTDVVGEGYFWLSYEDPTFNNVAFAYDFAGADNYDHNYQYDGTISLGTYDDDLDGNGDGEIIAAAVYTAKSDEQIEAAGVGFGFPGTDYEIKIYKGLTDENDPESGTLAGGSSGKTGYMGYYTLKLDDSVYVEEGETFSVVLTARNKVKASLFIDNSFNFGEGYTNASTEHDKTYLKKDSSWINFGESKKGTFRIKAFTKDVKQPTDPDEGSSGGGNLSYDSDDDGGSDQGSGESSADGQPAVSTDRTSEAAKPEERVSQSDTLDKTLRRKNNGASTGAGTAVGRDGNLTADAGSALNPVGGTDKSEESAPEQNNTETTQYVWAEFKDGRIGTPEGVAVTAIAKAAQSVTAIVTVGDGSIHVVVDGEEYQDSVGVSNIIALINAVLTPEQMQMVNSGEKLEIRIRAKDISDRVPDEDKDVIENGLVSGEMADSSKGDAAGELILGTYIDISMFIRIGDSDWNAVTQTGEPIEIVIGIPENLQNDERIYYIARSHEGTYTLLEDEDSESDTITIKTGLFSAYAIVFRQMKTIGAEESSGLFSSLSWTAVLLWSMGILVMLGTAVFLIAGKRRKDSMQG